MTEIDLDALEALANAQLVQCGPCDFGLVEYGCTCPKGDPRSVISQLAEVLAEVRQLREQVGEARAENRALNDAVEPFGECAPDCDCGDHQGVCLCHVTGAEAREWIRREEARADQAEKERDQLRAANIELAISNDALAFQANAANGNFSQHLRAVRWTNPQTGEVLTLHPMDVELVLDPPAGSPQGEGCEPK